MRHAFLIIAHNNPEILYAQIEILKDIGTDFYYHLDCGMDIDRQKLIDCAGESRVTFIESKKIKWGSYSQIDCEIRLLEAAIEGSYDYYHLLSGVDMPIKTKKAIDNFFKYNEGKEFIHFDSKNVSSDVTDRISLYHIMPGRTSIEKNINGLFVRIQKLFGVNRLKKTGWSVQKGANWFSITDSLAKYLINNKDLIRKRFSYSFCGDEVFLQTIVHNSEFGEALYDKTYSNDYSSCMRYIDWKRGNPYIFQTDDFQDLLQSKYLFARKFSCDVDKDIIEKLQSALIERRK